MPRKGYGFLKPPQCRPHQNEARHESGPSPKAATTDSDDVDSESSVAYAESFNRYRSEIYESFDLASGLLQEIARRRSQQYSYHLGSGMPPTRRSSTAFNGTIGIAREEGPWTRVGPTYVTLFRGFTALTSSMGSY